MADIFAGYRGLADIGTIGEVRFADANITARQEINAPDLIMGDWDHDAYVYGKIEVGGTISGPVTETFVSGGGSGLWGWGAKRTGDCGILSAEDVILYYYCGGSDANSREFTDVYVNSLGFSCAAGDIAQFTIDVMGKSAGSWQAVTPPSFQTAEKLITWDKVTVSINPGDEDFTVPANINYSNFEFTIANNLEAVYSIHAAPVDLFPVEIIPGLRTITGSISVYNTPESNGVDAWGGYDALNFGTITFDIGGLSVTLNVRFHRVEPASSVGPVVSTIGFTGVGHQTALDA